MQKARALLSCDLAELCNHAALRAQRLAIGRRVTASQARGLINALGSGPGRRQPARRRDELARYLAWRELRAKEDDAWKKLARRLTAEIGELEARCRDAVEGRRQAEIGYWQKHIEVLKEAQDWLELRVLEAFVHAYVREATAPGAAKEERK
jgi:hypothetical protein